jgi:uncharacterized membrane protein YfcA
VTREETAPILGGIGAVAGFVSGLLGIGRGLMMVPLLAGWLGMPLKRALGTSLLAIVALVVPGTVVHSALGHIDLSICLALMVGGVPGARLGAALALGAKERTLRLWSSGEASSRSRSDTRSNSSRRCWAAEPCRYHWRSA